jgi:hypothetical protein
MNEPEPFWGDDMFAPAPLIDEEICTHANWPLPAPREWKPAPKTLMQRIGRWLGGEDHE